MMQAHQTARTRADRAGKFAEILEGSGIIEAAIAKKRAAADARRRELADDLRRLEDSRGAKIAGFDADLAAATSALAAAEKALAAALQRRDAAAGARHAFAMAFTADRNRIEGEMRLLADEEIEQFIAGLRDTASRLRRFYVSIPGGKNKPPSSNASGLEAWRDKALAAIAKAELLQLDPDVKDVSARLAALAATVPDVRTVPIVEVRPRRTEEER